MATKAGAQHRRELHRAWREAVERNWLILLAALAIGVLVLAATQFVPVPTWLRGCFFGVFLSVVLVGLSVMVHTASGARNRLLGQLGEEHTGSLVDNRRRRHQGWRTVHGLYFDRHGDVDHVLLGPGGIYVIESKWTSLSWEVVGDRLVGVQGRDPLEQARAGAKKVEQMLRLGRPRLEVTVHPVLALRGPGAPEFPTGIQMVDGVQVLEGRKGRRCRKAFDGQVLDPEVLERAAARLLEHERAQTERRLRDERARALAPASGRRAKTTRPTPVRRPSW